MATPPTFVAEYESVWGDATTPKTASVTVAAGDTLTVIAVVENNDGTLNAPTGGGLTYTLQQSITITDYCTLYVWTAPSATSQTFTLSITRNGLAVWWGFNALRHSGSDGVGASTKTNVASGAPSLALPTTADNSAIVVVNGDWNAADGATRTWRTVNGITPTSGNGLEVSYFRDAAHYTVYGAYYSDAGTAGAKTVGLSAPSGQKYAIIAVEIKGTAGATTVNGTASLAGAGSVTATATVIKPGSASLTGAGTLTAQATVIVPGTASLTGTGTLTASSGTATPGTASLAAAGSLTAAGTVRVPGTASLAGAGSLTAAAQVIQRGTATLTGAGTLSAASGSTVSGTASLVGAGSLTATAVTGSSATASLAGAGTLSATATVLVPATAALVGAGSLTATGGAIISATAVLVGAGVLTATIGSAGPGSMALATSAGSTTSGTTSAGFTSSAGSGSSTTSTAGGGL